MNQRQTILLMLAVANACLIVGILFTWRSIKQLSPEGAPAVTAPAPDVPTTETAPEGETVPEGQTQPEQPAEPAEPEAPAEPAGPGAPGEPIE